MSIIKVDYGNVSGGGKYYYNFVHHSGTQDIDVGFEPKYVMCMRKDTLLDVYDKEVSATTVTEYSGSGWSSSSTASLPASGGLIRNISGTKVSIYSANEYMYLVAFG